MPISTDHCYNMSGEKFDALYLTPFIESNRIEEGRKSAEVTGLNWNIPSYSGLLTVNEKLGSNMFFWFVPSEWKNCEIPLIVWLNGLVTASSYGLLMQNGPFSLVNGRNLEPRTTSWHKYFNMLYIDNPVGVGYSFTKYEEGYSKTFDDVSANLHIALEQFMKLFPDMSSREMYLAGISLAGKYLPPLANRIIETKSFNLKGIFLGCPLIDLAVQLKVTPLLSSMGLIDGNQMKRINEFIEPMIDDINSENYCRPYQAAKSYYFNEDNILIKETGIKNFLDIVNPCVDTKHYSDYITSSEVRRSIHVGDIPFDDGLVSVEHFARVMLPPVTPYLTKIINNTKILLYAGQYDIQCSYQQLSESLLSLDWTGKEAYRNAERVKLYRDGSDHVWGYSKNYKTLTSVFVRNAGHSPVSEQPIDILNLLLSFTEYDRFK